MFRILNGRSCILFHFGLFDMVASWFGKLEETGISPKCTNTIQREIMQITVETVATTSSHFFFLGTPHGPNRYILFFRSDQIPFMISLLQYYLLFISLNDCNVYYLFKNNKVRWKHTSHT